MFGWPGEEDFLPKDFAKLTETGPWASSRRYLSLANDLL